MKRTPLLLFLCSSIAASDEVSFKSHAGLQNVVVTDTILIANEPVITVKGKAFISRYKLSDVETITKSSIDLTEFPTISHQDQLPEKQMLPEMRTDPSAIAANSVVTTAETEKWTIITSAGDTLWSCVIGRLEGSVVNLICGSSVIQMSVNSLSMLTRHGESHFWSGAGYGAFAGAAVGALVGVVAYAKATGPYAIDLGPGVNALGGAMLGGVAGFTIGGIIGAASGGGETYDLSQESTVEKIKILREIRREK
jgi:hypothetical protein